MKKIELKNTKEHFQILVDQDLNPLSLNSKMEWVNLLEIKKFPSGVGEQVCKSLGEFFDFMPGHNPKNSLHQLPKVFWKKEIIFPRHLTFYSGTFFPWHQGHAACLKAFPDPKSLLVLPDKNPWKESAQRDCPWSFFRELMLGYKDSPYSFYPGFLGLNAKNPTYEWLSKTLIPQKSLLLGDDTFLDLEKWHESKKLISLLDRIYVVPRLGDEKKLEEQFLKLKEINENLYIKRLEHHAYEDLSSTKLRK